MTQTKEELQARLDQVRARRAQLDAEEAERAQERSLAEQLEREERDLRDREAIAAAELEHGPLGKKIAAVRTDMGVVIVKRANHVLFRRWQDRGEKSMQTEELEKLVRPCLVHPDVTTFDRILDELPATLLRVADAVSVLAGVRAQEVSGKS